ncbi:MAG: ATP-binding cassette domain-containing protein [Spirochaetes bacterium]|nr:ATP-binding cassette domain-containing protein [Spirochaetota bacterium]
MKFDDKLLFDMQNIEVYIDGKSILAFDNVAAHSGETLAVVGPSGSGKSTFLKLFNSLVAPNKGIVRYKGVAYPWKNLSHLRSKITLVEQEPFLGSGTVLDALNIPFKFSVRKDKKFNEQTALNLFRDFKIDNITFDRKIDTLSGGEKQRIAIIRAVLLQPEVLLLDEPTSALDGDTVDIIIENILEKKPVETIISVSHSKEWTKKCSAVIEIRNGKIEKSR